MILDCEACATEKVTFCFHLSGREPQGIAAIIMQIQIIDQRHGIFSFIVEAEVQR